MELYFLNNLLDRLKMDLLRSFSVFLRTRNLAYITGIKKKITSYSDLDEAAVRGKTCTDVWDHFTR